ncbi:Laminin subunit beta-1, partial [Linum perenne]
SIQKTHSKKVATIQTVLDGDDDDEVPYNGILFFDGLGRIEGQKALTTLAQHLKSLHLLVSPEGYCFQDVSELGVYSDFGIHYLRLNDLFSWPCHGVELATTSNVWSRVKLKYHLPKHKNTSSKPTVGGGVSKEKYAELGKLVKEKDEELEKLKEEMEDAIEAREKKLQKLKRGNEEQKKKAQKKDRELQMLKKKKIEEEEELEKLNEDLEEANKVKDEELQKLVKSKNVGELQKQLKKKDYEFRMLKKRKDEEEEANTQRIEEIDMLNKDLEEANKANDAKSKNVAELHAQLKTKDDEIRMLKKKKDDEKVTKTQRIEELEKQKEDMEDAIKAKNEELQKFNKEKDEEIRKILKRKDVDLRALQNKKDDGDEKSKKIEELKKKKEEMELADKTKDEELKEATEKLYSGIAQAKKELEHCQKNSWAILPSTKFISQSLDANDKYLATRQPVPPGTFTCFSQSSFPYVSNSHKLVDKMRIDCDYNVKLVDEESSLAEWPPLPTMIVRIGRGNENFDKNNWWYLKTTHPEGGLTMVVFYDGNRSRISLDNYYNEGGDNVIPLPCSIDLEVYSYVYTFSIFRLRPFGVRFGFAYRPK